MDELYSFIQWERKKKHIHSYNILLLGSYSQNELLL